MKVFCCLCTQHIFDTTDSFKIGGPYNGGMFRKPDHIVGPYHGFYPEQGEWRVNGDLSCPLCEQDFMANGLLTEHGLIVPGQESLDTEFSILNDDGTVQYRMMLSREEKLFECEYCHRGFKTEHGLKIHMNQCAEAPKAPKKVKKNA